MLNTAPTRKLRLGPEIRPGTAADIAIDSDHGFAADPALPARDALLDPEFVRVNLPRLIGMDGPVEVCRATLVRAKYRIGESLRVVYRLDLASGAACTLTARVFTGGAGGAAARRALDAPGVRRPVTLPDGRRLCPVIHDADNDTVWWTFPNDRRLRGVADLLQPEPDLVELARAGGTWRSSEVVEYAPERSVTLRAVAANGSSVAYVKAYAPGTLDVAELALRYDAVAAEVRAASAGVVVPRPIGWCRERGLLVLEAMPGKRWSDLDHDDPGARASLTRLGAAIATFHAVGTGSNTPMIDHRDDLSGLPEFGRLRLERVGHSAELVARARPDLADSALRLRAALASGPPAGDDRVLLHGDCHPKNALLDGDRIVLVDLDQSGWGSPAADLGSLLGRLHQDAVAAGTTHPADAAVLGALVLDGYASVRKLPAEASLRWHTVAAIVAERAVRAVNRVNRPALTTLAELLALAEQIHRGGGLR